VPSSGAAMRQGLWPMYWWWQRFGVAMPCYGAANLCCVRRIVAARVWGALLGVYIPTTECMQNYL
jgi:hypothetical protein